MDANGVPPGSGLPPPCFSDPLTASYYADAGYRYWLKREFDAAADSFLKAHERESQIPEYAANAGICASAAGRYEEAEVLLRRALALGGENGEWENSLGLVLMALGETIGAIEVFRTACLSNPEKRCFHSESYNGSECALYSSWASSVIFRTSDSDLFSFGSREPLREQRRFR